MRDDGRQERRGQGKGEVTEDSEKIRPSAINIHIILFRTYPERAVRLLRECENNGKQQGGSKAEYPRWEKRQNQVSNDLTNKFSQRCAASGFNLIITTDMLMLTQAPPPLPPHARSQIKPFHLLGGKHDGVCRRQLFDWLYLYLSILGVFSSGAGT